MQELRRLIPAGTGPRQAALPGFPFGLAALDACLPDDGLPCGALHEVVPATQGALPAAFGFIVAMLARLYSFRTTAGDPPLSGTGQKIFFVMPAQRRRRDGRLSGHGLKALGLNPSRAILVETAHRKDTLWTMAEALRSGAPLAIAAMIDRLELKLSQKLQLAAGDAGRPLFLVRPAQTLEASAAATRWRVGSARSAHDRFGLYARPRWHLHLERCRNGRPGEWVVEYDHVAHRFSLVAALADPALSRSTSDRSCRAAHRS